MKPIRGRKIFQFTGTASYVTWEKALNGVNQEPLIKVVSIRGDTDQTDG